MGERVARRQVLDLHLGSAARAVVLDDPAPLGVRCARSSRPRSRAGAPRAGHGRRSAARACSSCARRRSGGRIGVQRQVSSSRSISRYSVIDVTGHHASSRVKRFSVRTRRLAATIPAGRRRWSRPTPPARGRPAGRRASRSARRVDLRGQRAVSGPANLAIGDRRGVGLCDRGRVEGQVRHLPHRLHDQGARPVGAHGADVDLHLVGAEALAAHVAQGASPQRVLVADRHPRRVCRTSAVEAPKALNTGLNGKVRTSRIPACSAMPVAWVAPFPPKARATTSAGSTPARFSSSANSRPVSACTVARTRSAAS